MEEDKQNEDTDVEKEMEDDGHRPLRDMSKRSMVMKDRTMWRCATVLAGYKSKLETCASEFNPTTPAAATHVLGVFVRFIVVCCGKRVRIPCFVEIVIDGVHTRTWRRTRRDRRYRTSVACTSAYSDYPEFCECDADED